MNERFRQEQEQAQDKELPAILETEQALLGALLTSNDGLYHVNPILEAQHFYDPLHADIFQTIQDIVIAGRRADPLSVKMQIKGSDRKVGSMTVSQYLVELVISSAGSAAIVHQATGIKETYNRRRFIEIGNTLADVGYNEGNPGTLIDQGDMAQSAIAEVCTNLEGKVSFSGANLAESYLASITNDPNKRVVTGVPIVLPEIATVLSERMWEASNLYGMLSSSGEGKSSMTMQILYHAAMAGHPTCFFSYDQTGEQCIAQIVAQQTGIEARRQKARDMTDKNIDTAYKVALDLSRCPFEIIDCSSDRDNTDKLLSHAKRFLKRHGNGKTPFFAIDHMGAIPPEYEDRKADEGTKAKNIGNKLKTMAKVTRSAVMVLQQRSGTGMKRRNPRPVPADLFGGEAARQPFDGVFYLYRAEEHMRRQLDIAENEKDKADILNRFNSMFPMEVGIEGTAEIGSLKVRFGKVGIRRYARFIAERTKYETLDRRDDAEQESFLDT